MSKELRDSKEVKEGELDVRKIRKIITEKDPPPKGKNGKYPFSCKINDHGMGVESSFGSFGQ